MVRKHTFKIVFALAVCLLSFVGVSAQSPVTITLWQDTLNGPEATQCYNDNVTDAFNAQNNGIRLETQLQPNLWDVTRTAISGGAGPDLVTTPGPTFVTQMAAAGFLAPLDAYAEQYAWEERFIPWALDLGVVNDALYSIPNEIETLVLYYNKTLFDANGWSIPTTFDEMDALIAQIEAAGIIPFAHANAEWRPANEWFVGIFLNNFAGPDAVYEALSNQRPWTDAMFVEAIDRLDAYQQRGSFMGGLDRYYTATFGEANAAIAEGRAAMKMEGSWFMLEAPSFFDEYGSEWNWAPLPTRDSIPVYSLGIGSTFSINNASPNKDAAAQVMDFIFSAEVQARLLVECNLAAAPIDIPGDLLTELDPRQAGIVGALDDATSAGNYGYTTWTFFPPQTGTYLIEQIESVWAGNITTAQFLQGMQDVFTREYAAGEVIPLPERGS